MVRGHAKQQAQERNAKLNAGAQKGSQLGKADVAMVFKCPLCLQVMPNVKLYHTHFQSKHPNESFPVEAQQKLDALNSKKAAAVDEKGAAQQPVVPKKKKKDDLNALLSEGLGKPVKKK